jgi:hypothetical protein
MWKTVQVLLLQVEFLLDSVQVREHRLLASRLLLARLFTRLVLASARLLFLRFARSGDRLSGLFMHIHKLFTALPPVQVEAWSLSDIIS